MDGSKLHLNSKGSAYLATNFLKALNTGKQDIKETSLTKDNHQVQSSSCLLDTRPSINNYPNPSSNASAKISLVGA